MIIISRRSMNHLFSMIPKANIPRSQFDRSNIYKTTFDENGLVPVYVDEVLPGDTFKMRANFFVRLQTLFRPIMDNLYLESFFFFVPYRLVWKHWANFMGEQVYPDDTTDYVLPTISKTNAAAQTLWDYFGLPTGVGKALSVSALPFRAYWLIYNEWFRDENLCAPADICFDDTNAVLNQSTATGFATNYGDGVSNLPNRGKRHDYFTSALPWAQKGEPVELPLGASADIVMKSGASEVPNVLTSNYLNGTGVIFTGYDNYQLYGLNVPPGSPDGPNLSLSVPLSTTVLGGIANNLQADLSSATAILVNNLRFAFQYQKLLERDARGGTRYVEQILSHFGVRSPDARLQRPEYLGGASTPITVNPVVQNGATNTDSPQGNLSAYGLSVSKIHGFNKSFTEHGVIIGLVNVRARLTYQQGINRFWSRQVRTDFYFPVFSHLGEQAILNKEIYAQGTPADNEAFGYQEAWSEYRYFPSKITGKFRSTDAQTLDVWHLAQKFENLPTLSQQFIEESVPVERVVAVADEPHFLMDAYFNLKCTRPMPVYSVPGLVDHF